MRQSQTPVDLGRLTASGAGTTLGRTEAPPAPVAVPRPRSVPAPPRPDRPSRTRHAVVLLTAMVVSDVVAVALATLLVADDRRAAVSYAVAALVLLRVIGPRWDRIDLGLPAELPRFARSCLLALIAPLLVHRAGTDATTFLLQALATLGLLAVSRGCCYHLLRAARRRGRLHATTVVLGDDEVATELVDVMRQHPEYGLSSVARPASTAGLRDVERMIVRGEVDTVVVAFGEPFDADLVPVLRSALARDVAVYVVPRLYQFAAAGDARVADHIWGFPLRRLGRAPALRPSWKLKRAIDVVVSGLALLLLSPVMAATAVALQIASPGPIFFRQPRIMKDGEPFGLIKFRTLRPLRQEEQLAAVTASSTQEAQRDRGRDVADRSTRVGRFARATSLDELPQLWNILKGEMSLVGARPEEERYARLFADMVPGYADRHRVTVGLTGWAQVHDLRGDTSIAQRVRFDNYYIDQWSLYRDVVVLFRTVSAVWRQIWSHRKPTS